MRRAGFSIWNDRIAPVFDVARQIYVVEAESGIIRNEIQEDLPSELPIQKAVRLAELNIGTLVCGAISRPLYDMIASYGIRVIPFVAGDLREVMDAWLSGRLVENRFTMPGCRRHGRRRFRGRHKIRMMRK
jgi:predicted Fe-Mo cluster-binding NifX family protein